MSIGASGLLQRWRAASDSGWLPLVVYGIAALMVLGPALSPGYLLTLDMVFAPQMSFKEQFFGLTVGTWASAPYLMVLQGSSHLIPGWLIQKTILVLAFAFAGLGAYRLVPFGKVPGYYAGFLYMFNPFTHVRLLAGQWTLLISYAVIPFAVKAFLQFLETGRTRDVVKVSLLWTLAGVFQIHAFALLGIIFLVVAAVHVLKSGSRMHVVAAFSRSVFVGSVVFVLLNLYWMLPTLSGSGERIFNIDMDEMQFFAPVSLSGRPVALEVAALEGFWTARGLVPSDLSSPRWALFAGVIFLWTYGLVRSLQRRNGRPQALAFGLLAFLGLLLALGVSTPVSRPVFEFLWDKAPFFRGFRDSHKFLTLLVLAYAYLGALGVRHLLTVVTSVRFHPWFAHWRVAPRQLGLALAVAVLLIPLGYGVRLAGFSGQVHPTHYPDAWYEARESIVAGPPQTNVLVLPWHQYLDIGWLPQPQQRVSNPARLFFGPSTIVGNSIEVGPPSSDPVSRYVDFLLENRDGITNLGELLAPINVGFVVLLKEVDYLDYGFLDHQKDLDVVLSNDRITLYKNTLPTSRVYGAGRVETVRNLEEFLGLSRTQDVLESVYVFDHGPQGRPSLNSGPLDLHAEGVTSLRIKPSDSKYAVLALGQYFDPEGWEYEGHSPVMQQLGFMPVFQVDGNGGAIRFTSFGRHLIWLYALSVGALLVAVGFLILPSRRAGRRAGGKGPSTG